jgi:uncharacterized protein with HEPN domain
LPRDDAHLLDILKAARLAIEFKGSGEKADFLQDAKTQSAVLHQLLIVGEAVKRLSAEFRAAHPEVPWRLIAGTRDKLIHFYEGCGPRRGLENGDLGPSQLIRQIELLAPPTRGIPQRS